MNLLPEEGEVEKGLSIHKEELVYAQSKCAKNNDTILNFSKTA